MGELSPAFSFYARDFMVGTAAMTLEQRGAYVTLMCYQWDAFAVPADDLKALGALLGVSQAKTKELWAVIGKKFDQGSDGLWRNARVEAERNKQFNRRYALAENGRRGGSKKASNALANATPVALAKTVATDQQKPSLAFAFPIASADLSQTHPNSNPSVAGEALWNLILQKSDLTEFLRSQWFTNWTVASFRDGERLEMLAPSATVRNWVNQHYAQRITEVVAVIAPGLRVSLVYKPQAVSA